MKYDIWMELSYGFDHVLEQAHLVMTEISTVGKDWVLINGLHRIGCAYRVQIECTTGWGDKIKKEIIDPLGLKMEESRGFSAS